MTTIHDIARESGYSAATVSRVLNHHKYVSPRVRAEVEAVIQRLNYVPNAVARDLSRGSTQTIGVVLPMLDHPYYTDLIAGIMKTAFTHHYRVVMLPSDYVRQVELDYLEQLRRHAYDGLIFTSHNLPLADLLRYQQFGPVVVCQDPGPLELPAAFTDRGTSYLEAMRWIQAQGATRVSLMLPRDPALSATASAMVAAFTAVFGHAPDPADNWVGSMTNEDGYAAGSFLAARQPDFIFANGDDIAAGVRRYYLDHQRPVPPMMGQENQLSGQLMNIATIDHHFKRVGAAALELAIGVRQGQVKIASDFIARS
ncbi:LacI family DNA-binding transcriptional regulator [Lacticaseibacillus daqingensis]|uniref:LacI family DNA-binding transcriptional regulator n=1 Tax=Lacticaseibacillus daqingensis TaxID=2486014 RepID=UPI000F776E4D|nr:LacI family DNA-binding transcriptional regulator [Lacticaseibacillus daqingensis]